MQTSQTPFYMYSITRLPSLLLMLPSTTKQANSRRFAFCPECNTKTIRGIILKLHNKIDLVEERFSVQEQ